MTIFVNIFIKNAIKKIDQSSINYHTTQNTIFGWLISFLTILRLEQKNQPLVDGPQEFVEHTITSYFCYARPPFQFRVGERRVATCATLLRKNNF